MSNLFVLPEQVPLTSAGKIYPGGKAFFYRTGTSTAKDTYSDAALTTPHANPVIADAGGAFPAIFLDTSDFEYRVTLKSSADVLIYTQDNVGGSLSQSEFNSLLSSAGGSAIGQGLYPRNAAEIAASVTPVNYGYPPCHVLRYGANTTPGTTDMTTAIQNAIKVQQASVQSSTFGPSSASGSGPWVDLGDERLKVTAALVTASQVNYLNVRAGRAIIEAAAGITVFNALRYMINIRHVIIKGGALHYSIDTDNADTAQVNIIDCESMEPTTGFLLMSADSNSTDLVVERLKFVSFNTDGYVANIGSCDYAKFNDCRITCSAPSAFIITTGELRINEMTGVDDSDVDYWVECGAETHIHLVRSRFGGEAGGSQIAVIASGSAETIEIDSCIAPSVGALIEFRNRFPKKLDVRGNYGSTPQAQLKVSSSSPPDIADVYAAGGGGTRYRAVRCGTEGQDFSVAVDVDANSFTERVVAQSLAAYCPLETNNQLPLAADVILNSSGSTGSFTPSSSASNITVTTPGVDPGMTAYRMTATANNASATRDYTTALAGVSAGVYTVIFDFSIDNERPITPIFRFNSRERSFQAFPAGRYTVCIPFYFDDVNTENIGMRLADVPNSAVLTWNRFRVYSGRWDRLSGSRLIMEGTAAPGSGAWLVGDTVQVVPTAGGTYGAVCTTAGSPGTWKTFGAIAA